MNTFRYRWGHLPWETIERQVYKLAIRVSTKPRFVAIRRRFTRSKDSYSNPGQRNVSQYEESPRTTGGRTPPG